MNENEKNIIELVLGGNCVLFLGAGATASSTLSNGEKSPLGTQLAELVYNKFYPEEIYEGENLSNICNMVNKKFGRAVLHDFFYSLFDKINPSDGLKNLSSFRWRNIYTTNIEQALEQAYLSSENNAQKLKTVIGPFDVATEDKNTEVTLYKLHGCISRKDVQLVFSLEEYANYKDDHLKLFNALSTDLIDYPIIFIGYSLQDSNFQEVWNTIKKYCKTRSVSSKYFFVSPYLKKPFVSYLESEGFVVFNQTLDEFSNFLKINTKGERKSLNDFYQENIKPVKLFETVKITAESKYSLSKNYDFPSYELMYPHPITKSFYNGNEPSWGDIKHKLDANRDLLDRLSFALDEWKENPKHDLWLITGRAGDGKSTLLRRFAAEAANIFGENVLYAKTKAELDPDQIINFYKEINQPLLIYIDNTADRLGKVNRLIDYIKSNKAKILIVGAVRTSDWTVSYKEFHTRAIDFKITILSDNEIKRIIEKLTEFDSLYNLKDIADEEKYQIFKTKSDRVLLVAMKEATHNKNFDDIIAHEYSNIKSQDAQKAYLHICLINQFRYKIPQSLLVRVLGYNINEIHEKIFKYTDEIIYIEDLQDDSDYLLRARHSIIADVVVKNYFRDDVMKFTFLKELLEKHIPSHSLEKSLVKKLYHHSTIKKLFTDLELGVQCYDLLTKELPEDYFILQQKALFLSDYKKDYNASRETITKALGLSNIQILQNTEGTIYLNESLEENDYNKSLFLMEKGKRILMSSIRKNASYRNNSYNYHSLINHLISWYQKFNPKDSKIIEEIQNIIDEALRKYPNDHLILTECGKLEKLLDKVDNAIVYFEKAIKFNPRNFSARYLLARMLINKNQLDAALETCNQGIKLSYESVLLNRITFEIMHKKTADIPTLKSHYDIFLSNNPNDDYLRLMYASFLYIMSDSDCDKHFLHLRRSDNIPFDQRYMLHSELDVILNSGRKNTEKGIVTRANPKGYYMQSTRFRTNTLVYLPKRRQDKVFNIHDSISYQFQFNFQGPYAINMRNE